MSITRFSEWKEKNPEKAKEICKNTKQGELAKVLELGKPMKVIYEQDEIDLQAEILDQEPIKSFLEESIIAPVFPADSGTFEKRPMVMYTNDFSRQAIYHVSKLLEKNSDIKYIILERDCFNDLTPEMHFLRSISVEKGIKLIDDLLICPFNSSVSQMANIGVRESIESLIYKKFFYFRPIYGDYIELLKEKSLIQALVAFVSKNYKVSLNEVYSLIYKVLFNIIYLEANYIGTEDELENSIVAYYENIAYNLYEKVFPISRTNLQNFHGLDNSLLFTSSMFVETIEEVVNTTVRLKKKYIKSVQSKITAFDNNQQIVPNDVGLIGYWKRDLGLYKLEDQLESLKSSTNSSCGFAIKQVESEIHDLESKISERNETLMKIYHLYLLGEGKYSQYWASMKLSVENKQFDQILLQEEVLDHLYQNYKSASRYKEAMMICAIYCISDQSMGLSMMEDLIENMNEMFEEDLGADAMVLYRLFIEMDFEIDIDFIVKILNQMDNHRNDKINKMASIIDLIQEKFIGLKANLLIDKIQIEYEGLENLE